MGLELQKFGSLGLSDKNQKVFERFLSGFRSWDLRFRGVVPLVGKKIFGKLLQVALSSKERNVLESGRNQLSLSFVGFS